jgi:hypothetical protein
MKYTVEMGSGTVILVYTEFNEDLFSHSKDGGGERIDGHTGLISLILFFFAK